MKKGYIIAVVCCLVVFAVAANVPRPEPVKVVPMEEWIANNPEMVAVAYEGMVDGVADLQLHKGLIATAQKRLGNLMGTVTPQNQITLMHQHTLDLQESAYKYHIRFAAEVKKQYPDLVERLGGYHPPWHENASIKKAKAHDGKP